MSGDDADSELIELGQNPSLDDSFEPLSKAHERALDAIEGAISDFAERAGPPPISIRGPFRTGKTALQYHGFKQAWKAGVPAVYVEASTLLQEYDGAAGTFESWVVERMREEVTAMANRDFDSLRWIPSGTGSDSWQDWVEANVPEDINPERGVIFIDEVEQEYTEFLSVTGVDDDNPLRKLLDQPNLLPVLSMGQLSAYEFIGDADLGRMKPVSIPPVTVEDIEDLLDARCADLALGRLGFWLTRGRAARVHQLVEEASDKELTPSDHDRVADWLSDYAHQQSSEFQPVRQIWEDPSVAAPLEAAGALAFDQDSYDDWVVESEFWFPADEVVKLIEDVVREEEPFASTDPCDDLREARNILRQCLEWVVESMAVPPDAVGPGQDERAVPSSWLSSQVDDREEGRALLSLVQDYLLAFEADREARDIAFDSLENAKDSFKATYDRKVPHLPSNEGEAWTLRPSVLEEAFPPLATDPSRLTNRKTDDLKDEMDRGLEVSVGESATVYTCPTQDSFEGQLDRLPPDPTHPKVILVSDEVDVEAGLDVDPLAHTLEAHDALDVVPIPTARVWEFVAQLFGRLDGGDSPYDGTQERIDALIDAASNREDRTTLETLYDHLSERVAAEAAASAVEAHRQQFDVKGTPLWAHPDVAGLSWMNPGAEWKQGRHAVATLLVAGEEPDWDTSIGQLLPTIEEGLEADTIDTKSTFYFKELLSHISESTGYGDSVKRPRRICRADADEGPSDTLERLQGAFEALVKASGYDRDAVVSGLYEVEGRPGSDALSSNPAVDLIDSFEPVDENETTSDVLWALVSASLVRTDETHLIQYLNQVEADLTELVQTLETYLEQVEEAESILAPEGAPSGGRTVGGQLETLTSEIKALADEDDGASDTDSSDEASFGRGVALDASHIGVYCENLTKVRDGIRNAKLEAEDRADFRPTAYALAVLGSRYEYVIRDAVDSLEQATPTDGTVSNVQQLRDEIEQLTDEDDDPALANFTDDRREAITSFADIVLDLRTVVDADTIPVGDPDGDGDEVLRRLDRAANERCRQVQELREELARLTEYRTTSADKMESTRRDIRCLAIELDDPETSFDAGEAGMSDATDATASGNQSDRAAQPTERANVDLEEANDD